MRTKQIIFAILICLMSAFAIITAILGQSETRIIKIEEVPAENQLIEESITYPVVTEPVVEQPTSTESIEIINSTTTDYATTTQ